MANQPPKKSADSGIHVAIENSTDLRMAVLDAAKKSVGILKAEQKVDEMRFEKQAMLEELKAVLADMVSLNNKLSRLLPRKKLEVDRKDFDRQIRQIVEDSGGMAEAQKPTEPAPKIDRLEDELAEIESRMRSLK